MRNFHFFLSKSFHVKQEETFRCKLKNSLGVSRQFFHAQHLTFSMLEIRLMYFKCAYVQPALAKLPQLDVQAGVSLLKGNFFNPCPLLFILLGIYNFEQTLGYSLNRAIKRKVKLSFALPNFSNDAVDLLRWGVTVQKGCHVNRLVEIFWSCLVQTC